MLSGLAVYAITAWGCRWALLNPFYGVVLYEGLALLRPQEVWHWSLGSSRLSLYAALATILGWLVNKSKCPTSRWTAHHTVLIVFWALLGLSLFDAHDQDIAMGLFSSFSKFFIFLFPLMALSRTPGQIRVLMWLVAGTIGFLAFQENYGYFTIGQSARREWGTIGGDNNHYAVLFVLAIPVTHALFLEEKDPRFRALAFALIPLMVHSVLLTFSRGGIAGLLLIAPFLLYYSRRSPGTLVAFAVLALVGFRLAGPSVRERFQTIWTVGDEDGSIRNRNNARRAAAEIMRHHPLTGIGLGCFRYVANDYYPDMPRGAVAHNSYYEMGAEAGIPALAAYLALIGLTFLKLWKTRRLADRLGAVWAYHYSAGLEVSMLGAGFCSYFLSNSSFELFYLLIGIAGALEQVVFNPEPKPGTPRKSDGAAESTSSVSHECPLPLYRVPTATRQPVGPMV